MIIKQKSRLLLVLMVFTTSIIGLGDRFLFGDDTFQPIRRLQYSIWLAGVIFQCPHCRPDDLLHVKNHSSFKFPLLTEIYVLLNQIPLQVSCLRMETRRKIFLSAF